MNNVNFHSPLADAMVELVTQKRALGCKYITEEATLIRFDRFLVEQGLSDMALPRQIMDRWTAKLPHESDRTHGSRISIARILARHLLDRGIHAYIPPSVSGQGFLRSFTPYIFTRREVRSLLAAADSLPRTGVSPFRHQVMAEIFRVLYGCGMRVGEVLRLTVADVDLDAGVLRVRQGKFRKDRLVPMAPSLTERLRRFSLSMGKRDANSPFFQHRSGAYAISTVYQTFRRLLRESGISHGGRGRGPRLHDLRHTFAVHRLEDWIHEGIELSAMLPVLSAYMGHRTIEGTQRYLTITPYIFPDLAKRVEVFVGHAIPGGPRP